MDQKDDVIHGTASVYVENMDQYDTVILIYPIWWGTLPQPVFTFLEEYDFFGKRILPLSTHEGSEMGSSEKDIAETVRDAELLEGLEVRGASSANGIVIMSDVFGTAYGVELHGNEFKL